MFNRKNTPKALTISDEVIRGDSCSYVQEIGSLKEFYIVGEIGEACEYTQWFHDIRNSRVSDVIKLYINCQGGNLFTTLQFLQVMNESAAHIIACVEGCCMSAATLIFLSAHEFQIAPNSMFMFHNYNGGTFGKGAEMYDGIVHERKWAKKMFSDYYTGFLTEKEIERLLNDKDLWMNSEEVVKRLEMQKNNESGK